MKQKIIQKSIELFNEKGFFDVRMRDISDALGISVGSITYHYKNKEALMNSIYRFMIKTIDEHSISDRLFQKKGEELHVAKVYIDYMNQFRFFFQDTLDIIRTYPDIGQKHQQQVAEEINIVKNILYMQVGKGVLIPEPMQGIYDTLAEMIWQTLHFWFTRQAIMGTKDKDFEEAMRTIVHLTYPYYTERVKLSQLQIMELIND